MSQTFTEAREAILNFEANVGRLDSFVNQEAGYSTNTEPPVAVPSLRTFMARIEGEADSAVAQAQSAAAEAQTAQTGAELAALEAGANKERVEEVLRTIGDEIGGLVKEEIALMGAATPAAPGLVPGGGLPGQVYMVTVTGNSDASGDSNTNPAYGWKDLEAATPASAAEAGLPGLAVYAADNDAVSNDKAATPAGVTAQIAAQISAQLPPLASEATAGTIMLRDSAGRAQVVAPSANDDITNKSYVDSAVSEASSAASAKASKPKAASGVGQWVVLNFKTNRPSIPSGGTWAYYAISSAGIIAGGTLLSSLGIFPENLNYVGFAWRIA